MPQNTKPHHDIKLPSLDGWRALSILLVLLAHSVGTRGFPQILLPIAHNGPIGVRFFFVISGFLITWLLLQEHEKHGEIRLNHFYMRRVLRIFPVYYSYLIVVGFFTHYSQSPSAWFANLTFTTNFFHVNRATEHLWSLGVEEQFYLIWPFLLMITLKQGVPWQSLTKLLLVPVLIAPAARFLVWSYHPHSLDWLFQGFSFICQFDSLAYGCISAILFVERREHLVQLNNKYAKPLAFIGIALILFPMFAGPHHWVFNRLGEMCFISIQGVGFSVLLVQSLLQPKGIPYYILNWRWVRHIGVLSYSIYIWQQMFFSSETVFAGKDAWWATFPVWILVTLIAAHGSYYMLERPLFGLRTRFRST